MRQCAFGADGGEHALDRIGRAQMVPVLGGEVVEDQQRVTILGEAGDRFLVLGPIRRQRSRQPLPPLHGPALSRPRAGRPWPLAGWLDLGILSSMLAVLCTVRTQSTRFVSPLPFRSPGPSGPTVPGGMTRSSHDLSMTVSVGLTFRKGPLNADPSVPPGDRALDHPPHAALHPRRRRATGSGLPPPSERRPGCCRAAYPL